MTKRSQPSPPDLSQYPRPNLAVDLVLLTVRDDALQVMMMERPAEPFAGRLVLPGGFVHPEEALQETARRVLRCKTGLDDIMVEQLFSFSAPGRDPRGWVVSVAYFALVPAAVLLGAMDPGQKLRLVTIEADAERSNDAGLERHVRLLHDGDPVEPGFDHLAIISAAVARLRAKLDWSLVAFGLLREEFTLFDLQRVHEVVLGRPLLKSPFRKKMLERAFPGGRRLVPTGRFDRSGRHRPAELYRLEPGLVPHSFESTLP